MRSSSLLLMLVAACVSSQSKTCPDDRVCPQGTVCAIATYDTMAGSGSSPECVTPDQAAQCDGKTDDSYCTTSEIADGRCHGGVCLSIACGDGRIDHAAPEDPMFAGEACDDGNQADGDGCSARCDSNETCQNGVVDLVKREECDDGNNVDGDGCSRACADEIPRWEIATLNEPPMRFDAAMAWDGARHQMILFGGRDARTGDPLGDTWVWKSSGWRQLAPVVSPGARYEHRMAYDSGRGRIVLYGGVTIDPGSSLPALNDETWEWAGDRWQQSTASGPGPRSLHGMAYDEQRHAVIVYGGRATPYATISPAPYTWNDTWAYDGTTWTNLGLSGPTPPPPGASDIKGLTNPGRIATAMGYDPARGKVVLFGGAGFYGFLRCTFACIYTADEPLADDHTWELDATGWHESSPAAPTARRDAAIADDPAHGVMVLFGGNDGVGPLGDQWTWDGSVWTSVTPTGVPPTARAQHVMATDVARQTIVVTAGAQTGAATTWDPYTYELPPAGTWSQNQTPRLGSQLLFERGGAYDRVRERAVIVEATANTVDFDENNFSAFADAGPPLDAFALAYDVDTRRTLLYGVDGNTSLPVSELWDGQTWTMVTGPQPPATTSVALAEDPMHHEIVLLGNTGGTMVQWKWNGSWSQVQPAHLPTPRSEYALAGDLARGQVVLYGGLDASSQPLADTWVWDGSDWTQKTASGPGPRSGHRMVWEPLRHSIALFGGANRDTWEWTDKDTWEQLAIAPGPSARQDPVMFPARDGRGIYVYGGSTFDDLWELRWVAPTPPPLCDSSLCSDPDCWYSCAPLCDARTDYATCSTTTSPRCGDGTCDPDEQCWTCASDCGACP